MPTEAAMATAAAGVLTRWRTAVQYAGSYRSGSNFRQKGVRNDHLEMLKAATVAAAPRQQQQCWTRPCNDSSQLRVIEASIGANKEKKKSLFAKHTSSNSFSTFTSDRRLHDINLDAPGAPMRRTSCCWDVQIINHTCRNAFSVSRTILA